MDNETPPEQVPAAAPPAAVGIPIPTAKDAERIIQADRTARAKRVSDGIDALLAAERCRVEPVLEPRPVAPGVGLYVDTVVALRVVTLD